VKVFRPLIEQQEQGHINSTASIAGLMAGGAAGPYNVAKHRVVALMATLERELRAAHSTVRASVLCPGAVNTNIAANSTESRRAHRGEPPSRSREGDKLGDRMTEALSSGMAPDEVGALVLDAIINDKFWIFTEPRLLRMVQEEFELMRDERLLSRLRLFS